MDHTKCDRKNEIEIFEKILYDEDIDVIGKVYVQFFKKLLVG